jgi:hypothetical protein
MGDMTQVAIVTTIAGIALVVLLRPYLWRPARKSPASPDAGCPGCGSCADTASPPPRT